ncbi:hypothetical protein LPJ68_004242 [Coemansia sp. RSA 1086]|nr:hypothetical protein LPJ68_004242 [Coemansia sp. RSA 1086]
MQRAALLFKGLLRHVDSRWLELAIAFNIYPLVWRTYVWALDAFDEPYGLLDSEWLMRATTILSLTGLVLLVLYVPLYLLRLAIHSTPSAPADYIQQGAMLLVSVATMLSNYSGLIDITLVPLVADLALFLWRGCAILSMAMAALAFPLHVSSSQQLIHRLFLPAIVTSVCASDLTLIQQPHVASPLLSLGYIMWGAVLIPSLCFAVRYIHLIIQQCRLSCLLSPLAHVSQLAVGVMSLGVQSQRVWASPVGPATAPLLLGELAMAAGAILGLLLWASAAMWFVGSHALALQGGFSRERVLKPQFALVLPVASFALATMYVSRIWASASALVLSQLLILHASAILLLLPAAHLARVLCTAIQRHVFCRRSPPPLAARSAQLPSSYDSTSNPV